MSGRGLDTSHVSEQDQYFEIRERMLEKERSERLVDLRRDEQLAEAAVEESDTGLQNRRVRTRSTIASEGTATVQDTSTYTKDQEASNNGGVLGRGDFIVEAADKALLRATAARDDNALVGGHILMCIWDKRVIMVDKAVSGGWLNSTDGREIFRVSDAWHRLRR